MKKFLTTLSLLLVTIFCLSACVPFPNTGEVKPEDYGKYFSKIGFSNTTAAYEYREMSIDNFTNSTTWELEEDYYTGMQLHQKAKVKIKGIGFAVKADKDCELNIRFRILLRNRSDLLDIAEDPEIDGLNTVIDITKSLQVYAGISNSIYFEFDDVVLRSNNDDDRIIIWFNNNRSNIDGSFVNTEEVKLKIDDILIYILKQEG